jgi:hypothetical protein
MGRGHQKIPLGKRTMRVTSNEKPFLTMDIDLKKAERAKDTYPRYVPD